MQAVQATNLAMGQNQNMTLGMKLAPQLRLMMRYLAMPVLELREEIKNNWRRTRPLKRQAVRKSFSAAWKKNIQRTIFPPTGTKREPTGSRSFWRTPLPRRSRCRIISLCSWECRKILIRL